MEPRTLVVWGVVKKVPRCFLDQGQLESLGFFEICWTIMSRQALNAISGDPTVVN
jgi:hypothetical protein